MLESNVILDPKSDSMEMKSNTQLRKNAENTQYAECIPHGDPVETDNGSYEFGEQLPLFSDDQLPLY